MNSIRFQSLLEAVSKAIWGFVIVFCCCEVVFCQSRNVFGPWHSWSRCSVSCGRGRQVRWREHGNSSSGLYDNSLQTITPAGHRSNGSLTFRSCEMQPCSYEWNPSLNLLPHFDTSSSVSVSFGWHGDEDDDDDDEEAGSLQTAGIWPQSIIRQYTDEMSMMSELGPMMTDASSMIYDVFSDANEVAPTSSQISSSIDDTVNRDELKRSTSTRLKRALRLSLGELIYSNWTPWTPCPCTKATPTKSRYRFCIMNKNQCQRAKGRFPITQSEACVHECGEDAEQQGYRYDHATRKYIVYPKEHSDPFTAWSPWSRCPCRRRSFKMRSRLCRAGHELACDVAKREGGSGTSQIKRCGSKEGCQGVGSREAVRKLFGGRGELRRTGTTRHGLSSGRGRSAGRGSTQEGSRLHNSPHQNAAPPNNAPSLSLSQGSSSRQFNQPLSRRVVGGTSPSFGRTVGQQGMGNEGATNVGPPEDTSAPAWSTWNTWSQCSESCEGGKRRRYRECQDGNRQLVHGCNGDYLDIQECNTQSCPIASPTNDALGQQRGTIAGQEPHVESEEEPFGNHGADFVAGFDEEERQQEESLPPPHSISRPVNPMQDTYNQPGQQQGAVAGHETYIESEEAPVSNHGEGNTAARERGNTAIEAVRHMYNECPAYESQPSTMRRRRKKRRRRDAEPSRPRRATFFGTNQCPAYAVEPEATDPDYEYKYDYNYESIYDDEESEAPPPPTSTPKNPQRPQPPSSPFQNPLMQHLLRAQQTRNMFPGTITFG